MVLVQDFHLALVPSMLKALRPDLRVGLFWHIPWPMAEAVRICPWRVNLLEGMLGADLVGFHLQQYCNNFLDTVDRMIEARLDRDHFSVELRGHTTTVRPLPIGVEDWADRGCLSAAELEQQIVQLRETLDIGDAQVMIGVDRIDYTKGLPERFRAIERFFEKHPEHRGRWTLVQIGAPSRTHIRRYRELMTELEALADEINWKLRMENWKPIHFMPTHHDSTAVHALLFMARVCIVSSLHDGMNLVAKEFVAARRDGDGVLLLSEFAGAARELTDALLINPYDTESFSERIREAVEMTAAEQQRRMERMRKTVSEHNVYCWAASFMASLAEAGAEPVKTSLSALSAP
jgi:trehalose 6-phosphate synthase